MASAHVYVELAAVKSLYYNTVCGVRIVKTRAKAPKKVAGDTRWVLITLDVEDPDELFKNEQLMGAFGVIPPRIEATLG